MSDALIRLAHEKLRQGPILGEIAAVLDRETGEPSQGGRQWRFLVARDHKVICVEAFLVGSEGGSPNASFEPALLEAAVERRIARSAFRSDFLLNELAVAGPIQLFKEDLRRHPARDGSVFF